MVPGEYVLLDVRDTGSGMTEETLSHLFEPFFTTKEVGTGTGLGLSIVYGIIRQGEGCISVDSEPGAGTTFHIYLPRATEGATTRPAAPRETATRRGVETILVAEDESSVRKLITLNLRRQGYTVMEAANGAEAIRICQASAGTIHLLLTDVVMPGIRGGTVAEHFRSRNPGAPVIYMTGYSDTGDLEGERRTPHTFLLPKPFAMSNLLSTVRDALQSRQAEGA